jgi:hypothetical protein
MANVVGTVRGRAVPIRALIALTGVLFAAGAFAQQPEPAPDSAAQPPSSSAAVTADEAFTTRVKTLEEQVVDLKEKIFRTKARLLLLQETVLGGDLSQGARAVIFHKNEFGAGFAIESVTYALDGAAIFTKVNENGALDGTEEIEIFNGRIIPGKHQLAVIIKLRGKGYGVFSYVDQYSFKMQGSHTFNAAAGKVTTVRAIGYDKGGFTAEFKDRPGMKFSEEVTKDAGMKPAQAAADGK